MCPDVIVHICRNCLPADAHLPRQWEQDGVRVAVREVPCSGKVDGQYMFHALEAGVQGLCLVTCPPGECTLAQGNYRAEVRVRTLRRLLDEIGLEPDRAELLHSSPDDPPDRLETRVREVVQRFCTLGPSPIRAQPVGEQAAV